MASALPDIRSMLRRWASSSFAAEATRPHTSTSGWRATWRVTRWNASSLIDVSAPANGVTRSKRSASYFGTACLIRSRFVYKSQGARTTRNGGGKAAIRRPPGHRLPSAKWLGCDEALDMGSGRYEQTARPRSRTRDPACMPRRTTYIAGYQERREGPGGEHL